MAFPPAIDGTFSPYIALHFLCEDIEKFNQDGVLWCVDYYKTKEFLPARFKQALETENARSFDISTLKSVCPTLKDLNNYLVKDGNFIVFFEPPSMDERIVHQIALFSFMSDPNVLMNDWLNDRDDLYLRLIIPAKLKWEIRD